MSLPDQRTSGADRGTRGSRTRYLLRASALALALLAGGCSDGAGFRPLYATNSISGGSTEQKMAQVDVAAIPSRVGQRVRNELIFQSTGGGAAATPAYRLEVAIREALQSTLIARTGDAGSQIYSLDASFRLIRLSDKKVVFEGSSVSRAGFERHTTIYSNVRAREDAENRAARVIAQDVKARLAAFLATES